MARLMLSLGMFSALAAAMALRKRGLPSGSPPDLAAMLISLMSCVKILPRLASSAPFLCLIVAHLEWPDMGTSETCFRRNSGAKRPKKEAFPGLPATVEYSRAHVTGARVRLAPETGASTCGIGYSLPVFTPTTLPAFRRNPCFRGVRSFEQHRSRL